jgi:DNA-directed RNA polymerase specialized sigma24 family protein
MPEQQPVIDYIESLTRRPQAAMDLWWSASGDDWPVPDDLPGKFLAGVLEAADPATPATLRELEQAIAVARERLAAAVLAKREEGWSWARIGRELGVSRQAAWERFHG